MPFHLPTPVPETPAWVIFCDAPDIWWLRPLRAGFRHCFVVLQFPGHDVSIDPLLGTIEVMTHPNTPNYNLIQTLKDAGLHIIKTHINQDIKETGTGFLCTCVTITKRVLGLRAPLIQTPYALYRHLCTQAPITTSSNTLTPLTLDKEI